METGAKFRLIVTIIFLAIAVSWAINTFNSLNQEELNIIDFYLPPNETENLIHYNGASITDLFENPTHYHNKKVAVQGYYIGTFNNIPNHIAINRERYFTGPDYVRIRGVLPSNMNESSLVLHEEYYFLGVVQPLKNVAVINIYAIESTND